MTLAKLIRDLMVLRDRHGGDLQVGFGAWGKVFTVSNVSHVTEIIGAMRTFPSVPDPTVYVRLHGGGELE